MARLRPAFKADGTVTAGNSSGVNDAGAAVVLMSAREAERSGAPVLGRILAYASCGVDPRIMGIGPVPATTQVLRKAGRSFDEVGVIELNEAFAAQAPDRDRRARSGPGAGQPQRRRDRARPPVAATGGAITVKLLAEMRRGDHELGLATLCIAGGQGIALLVGATDARRERNSLRVHPEDGRRWRPASAVSSASRSSPCAPDAA